MNILKSINISKFRGLDHLIIEDFSRINLFIGRNNSGKSSILESIFLLIGMSNPGLPEKINQMRGLKIKTADDFKYVFNKLNFNNNPEFKGAFSDSLHRTLRLNPIYGKLRGGASDHRDVEIEDLSSDASTASPNVTGIELDFSIKRTHQKKESYKNSITYNFPSLQLSQNNKYREELQAVYIYGNSNDLNTLARYSEIVKLKKSDIVLSALQLIDPNIESIHALPDGLFFSYKDIDELLPSNISGDGVRKYLNIITTIVERKNNIILIDEIENGLHYSAHSLLWKSILSMLNLFDVQLFISTHNIETLKCLKELLDESDYVDSQDKIAVYKLLHTKNAGIKTYRYSYGGFKEAIETETELR